MKLLLMIPCCCLHESGEKCKITGPITSAISKFTELQSLKLDDARVSGTLPAAMSSLTKLELLDLGNNTVVGPIPTWIGSLRELQEIDLTNNRMSGQIPSQIGSLTKLVSLELAFNNLVSVIPQSITSLPLLEYLEVKNNLLAGSLPAFSGSSLQTVVLVSLEPLQQRGPSTENLTSHQPNHLGQQRRSLWEPGNSVLVCIQVHQKIFLYVSTRLGLL